MAQQKRNVVSFVRTSKIHLLIVIIAGMLSIILSLVTYKNFPNPDTQTVDQTSALDIKPVSYWEEKFLQEVWPTSSYTSTKCQERARNPADDNMYYFGTDCIDGLTAMFEATGKTQYLDRAIEYTNTLISVSYKTGNFQDWKGTAGYPLTQSHSWRHVTKLLFVIKNTPPVYQNTKYRAEYDKILAFTEKNIFEKWYTWSADRIAQNGGDVNKTYIYRSRAHMASHWAYIGMILEKIGTRQDLMPKYREVYTKINTNLSPYYNSSLRAKLEKYPGDSSILIFHDEWTKDYDEISERPKPTPREYDIEAYHPVSDTLHAQDTIGYIIEGYERGVYWNRSDIDGLINLMKKLTWNKSMTDPKFARFLDGTEGFSDSEGQCIEDGMIKLGQFDPQIQQIIQVDTPAGCYPMAFYGHAARNAAKLSRSANASPSPVIQSTSKPATATPITTKAPATSQPTIRPSIVATPQSTNASLTSCTVNKSYSQAAGEKWYASKEGIANRAGLILQADSQSKPVYLARYNGSTYSYSSQLPYAPLSYKYPDNTDFMIYSNSNPISFNVNYSGLTSYALKAGTKWYAKANGFSPNGLLLQAGKNSNPSYLAPWNGTTYSYKAQLPYEPQWMTYTSSEDFMIYSNSADIVLNVCKK